MREKSIRPKGQRRAQFKSRPTTHPSREATPGRGIRFGARWPFFYAHGNIDQARFLSHISVLDCFNSQRGRGMTTGRDRPARKRSSDGGCDLTCKCSTCPRYLRRSLDSDPVRCPRTSGTGKWPQDANRSRGREHVSPVPLCETCGRAILLQN